LRRSSTCKTKLLKKSRIATRLTYYGERRESLECGGDSREVCEFTLAEDSARFASFGAYC